MYIITTKNEFINYWFDEIRMIDYIIKKKKGGSFNRNNNEFNTLNNVFNNGNSNPFNNDINQNNEAPSPFSLMLNFIV